jgi:hypothetical protein
VGDDMYLYEIVAIDHPANTIVITAYTMGSFGCGLDLNLKKNKIITSINNAPFVRAPK